MASGAPMTVRQRYTVGPINEAGSPVGIEPGSLRVHVTGGSARVVEIGERDFVVEHDGKTEATVFVMADAEVEPGFEIADRIVINMQPTLWQRVRAWFKSWRREPEVTYFEDEYPDFDPWHSYDDDYEEPER